MNKSKLFSRMGLAIITLPWIVLLGYYTFVSFVDPEKERTGVLFALAYAVMFGIAGLLIGVPFLVRSLLYKQWEKEGESERASDSVLQRQMFSAPVFFTIIGACLVFVVLVLMPKDFLATLKPLFTLFFRVW